MTRRYSGYDEYEGVFGPLGVYGASSGRRHLSRRLNGASALDGGALGERGRYLAERRARRRLRTFDVENDSEVEVESEREGAEPIALQQPQAPAPPHAPLRQVWLPTRNFSFRQRAGKLDTRAIARLDLERVVATTDIDVIQRHLENLAFADVTIEDVQHYSDAYFLKLFQIAQLTLEYLLNVQDSLVSHSESIETQCEQLLDECRQLESENGAFEAEIAGLKKDVRHKQRTLATFEVMLLNASVSQRRAASTRAFAGAADKENAAAEANAVVDSLLGAASGAEEKEDGVVSLPVDCVVCGKKFLSAAYLVRHQQRKHQTKKPPRKPKRASPSPSPSPSLSSASDSSKKRGAKTAPLPAEVVAALQEKNEFAKQLLQLQEQLQLEKAARDAQTKLLENQQSQLTAQVAGSMGKLQELLLEIEKKQEAAKNDILQHTQSTIARLQAEAANARVLKRESGGVSSSRAGKIESDEDKDEGPRATKRPIGDADRSPGWHEAQLEKMLEVFFKAQAQQQQEIDALAQENSKLWSRKHKKKHHRPNGEPLALLQMAALDAQRFGVDNGVVEPETLVPSVATRPAERLALQEDKLVQTDEEEAQSKKPTKPAALRTQEVQTDKELATSAPAAPTVAPAPAKKDPPPRCNTVDELQFAVSKRAEAEAKSVAVVDPLAETHVKLEMKEEKKPQSVESKETKLQHAAHVVGKVALGFLARRRLENPANWLVGLPLAALEVALSEDERNALRRGVGNAAQELAVEVELEMTANELRLEIARALSGEKAPGDNSVGIDYHRVLLHHSDTREELHGDRAIHGLRNKIEVELVPTCQAAEEHADSVCTFHSDVTTRLQDIRRASTQLAQEDSDESVEGPRLRRLVRLQAHVRGFLAKRRAATIKIDRLVEMRVLRMREAAASASQRRSTVSGGRTDASSSLLSDPVVAEQHRKVRERLQSTVKDKLALGSRGSIDSASRMSADTLEQQLRVLEQERAKLPADVQERIRSLQTRLERMVRAEYDPEHARVLERQHDAAVTIQSAVHVAIARRRLQTLLARDRADAEPRERGGPSPALSPVSALSDDADASSASHRLSAAAALRSDASEHLDDFDTDEIEQLANAYEEGGGQVSTEGDRSRESSGAGRRASAVSVSAPPVVTPTPPPPAEQPSTPPPAGAAEMKPAAATVARRSMPLPPKLTPTLHSERPSTPLQSASEAAEPGRSPRPKLQEDKEVISPFSKTPLLSRRSAPATRRGSGYDNAR